MAIDNDRDDLDVDRGRCSISVRKEAATTVSLPTKECSETSMCSSSRVTWIVEWGARHKQFLVPRIMGS